MSSDFSDLLVPELVLASLAAATRKAMFQQVAGIVAPVLILDAQQIADRLTAREKLGSTGFGEGVAIPHARIDGLAQIVAIVVRLVKPIDFKAVDDLPVDIAVVLLSPPDAGSRHLKALARVSRRLRDSRFVAKLRGAASRDALYALLTADEARDAA